MCQAHLIDGRYGHGKDNNVLKPWFFIGDMFMYRKNGVNDRRRFQRLRLNLTAWYRIESPLFLRNIFGDKEIEAITLDIGKGGISLITKNNIPVWATLIIKFILFKTDNEGLVSFSDPVEIIGEVRSNILLENNEYRLGICFKQIKKEDRYEIDDFVDSAVKA